MASIQQLGKRRFWFAAYRDATGKQHFKSTKLLRAPEGADPKERAAKASENKRLAQDIANRLEQEERGNATEAHLRKVLADISQRVNKNQIEFAITEKHLQQWLTGLEKRRMSPATIARYRGTVTAFIECLGAKAKATLADIGPRDVQKFVEARLEGGRNPTTVKVDIKTLNAPFAVALKQGLILSNPVPAANIPQGAQEAREPFTFEQVQDLLAAAQGEWKTAIMLGTFTGMRLGDCASTVASNFNFEKHTMTVRAQKTRAKKKDLELPLHPDLEAYLLDLPVADGKGWLCPTLAQAEVGGRRGLSRQFQDIMERAGIVQKAVAAGGKAGRAFNRYGFHSFRHTFVSLLANAGIAPDVRQKLAGHADEKSHTRYTHTELETLRKAVNSLPRLTK